MELNKINHNLRLPEVKKGTAIGNTPAASFQQVLNNTLEEQPLQFSKHAMTRLNSRDIALSQEQMSRINEGVTKARDKGIRDSLVLVDGLALVVNIKNKTVITAMNQQNAAENVFTNIDGAVIV